MIVTPVDIPLFFPAPDPPRPEGLHVSSLIRCIAIESGLLPQHTAEDLKLTDVRLITDPEAILRMSIGLAWEDYYVPKILSHYGVLYHPGCMQVDGIYMTHDGESVSVIITDDKQIWGLSGHEVKATYKSINTVGNLAGEWMWLAQMKAYCKGLKTRFFFLHVLYLCGDYSRPIKPQRRDYQIEFTQQEIDDNWELLTDYKRHREILDGNIT